MNEKIIHYFVNHNTIFQTVKYLKYYIRKTIIKINKVVAKISFHCVLIVYDKIATLVIIKHNVSILNENMFNTATEIGTRNKLG